VLYIGSQDRDQLATMLRGAVLLLNPSRSETYGLINLEASASGVPVVATRTGGMVESVVDGVTGVLLDSRDPQVWAAAVLDFLVDEDRRARFGRAGREFAGQRSWDVVGAELEAVYRREVRR
ncbi:MAG: glycosyltransferase, partial [Brooklawnia sp.]|uniref:glycosyltransferase n=1 Tax=Brooklawnia sp. TaxID=2699740 RepID=UPI003C71F35E